LLQAVAATKILTDNIKTTAKSYELLQRKADELEGTDLGAQAASAAFLKSNELLTLLVELLDVRKTLGEDTSDLEKQIEEILSDQTVELNQQESLLLRALRLLDQKRKLTEDELRNQRILNSIGSVTEGVRGFSQGFQEVRELRRRRREIEIEMTKARREGDRENVRELKKELELVSENTGNAFGRAFLEGLQPVVQFGTSELVKNIRVPKSDKQLLADQITDSLLGTNFAKELDKPLSKFQQGMIEAASQFGVALGQAIGGGGPGAGTGANIGAGIGSLLGLTPLGPAGAVLGSALGGAIGGAIGGTFDEKLPPLEDELRLNTEALKANTQTLKEFSETIINAPAGFTSLAGGQRAGGFINPGGGGGGVTIVVQAGSRDIREIADGIGRELGIQVRRGGNTQGGDTSFNNLERGN
jgi:hypothetical protein